MRNALLETKKESKKKMSDKIYIGIDPGANGALAVDFGESEELLKFEKDIRVYRFCKVDESVEIALQEIKEIAHEFDKKIYCGLEKVGAMPGQGVSTMFAFGENFGRCKGALRALKIPFELITPQTWQKGLGLPKCAKDEDKKAFKVRHKKLLYQKAKDLFPAQATSQDKADALLILNYIRNLNR